VTTILNDTYERLRSIKPFWDSWIVVTPPLATDAYEFKDQERVSDNITRYRACLCDPRYPGFNDWTGFSYISFSD
jgi:hypothetical protein